MKAQTAGTFLTLHLLHLTDESALIIQLCVCSHLQCLQFGTHTGMLLEFVQEVFGRNEVVQEVTKTVVLIGRLQDREDLDKYVEER